MQRLSVISLVLFVLIGAVRSEVIIDADTTLDYTINDDVVVVAGANPPTTVQFVESGDVHNIALRDDSVLNMTSGFVHGYLTGYGTATLNVLDGFFGLGLEADDQSNLFVSGGSTELLTASGSSLVDFSGGFYELVSAHDSAHLEIWGDADMDSVSASGTSTVAISGGQTGGELGATQNSVITVFGSGFNYPLGEIQDASGTLTGTLADGQSINTFFHISGDASILLVPEPSTFFALLSVVAAVLAVCLWRKR
jgi:hypothetical protein